jgi:hypothetical protein
MNTFKMILAVALFTGGGACALAQVGISQTNPIPNNPNGPAPMPGTGPVRLTNEATSTTGTIIKRDLEWSSKIPLNKTYAQFSESEKAEFHALYESMPPGDEPPFPAEGLRPVFNSIKKGQQIVRARGRLNMVVNVDATGKAVDVVDLGGVGGANALEMTRFAGSVLLMTKFKPAVCAGKPCKSQFPFILELRMH